MVDRDVEVLTNRLARLEELIAKLDRQQPGSLDVFLADQDGQELAERRLQLAAQIAIDLANYVLARASVPPQQPGQGLFELLERAGVIDGGLARRLQGLVGFRNILVHDYLKIDPATVYRHLTERLDDFRDFAHAIVLHTGLGETEA